MSNAHSTTAEQTGAHTIRMSQAYNIIRAACDRARASYTPLCSCTQRTLRTATHGDHNPNLYVLYYRVADWSTTLLYPPLPTPPSSQHSLMSACRNDLRGMRSHERHRGLLRV